MYETYKDIPGYLVANTMYGPSYLSFDFALSYHFLIPKGVYVFTSATFEKMKEKNYDNYYGSFHDRDVPADAFPYEIMIMEELGYSFKIATPEKAICDKLYTMKPAANKKELIHLLFDDLRVDEEELQLLNKATLYELCDLYHCTNLKLLKKVIKR